VLTYTLLKLSKTEIKLNMVALIPLCKILKDTNVNFANHMQVNPSLYIK
jgi:hypothetical protein